MVAGYFYCEKYMLLMKEFPTITKKDADDLVCFIKDTVQRSGCSGAVIGLSGGLDSAVVAKLSADALGPENVLCIFMPTRSTPKEDYALTSEFTRSIGTGYEIIDITPATKSFDKILGLERNNRLERGNISARCRMIILYDQAKMLNRLVVGTSNKSEMMMGYFTKHGDGACDVRPLMGLYKTQVRELARIIGIPEEFITKPPSAGLWPGQTDEDEMQIAYADLDRILFGIESGMSDKDIASECCQTEEKVTEIRRKVSSTEHKRSSAYGPE